VHETWLLSVDETELLIEVCRMLDTCDRLQTILDSDGVVTTGSMGQARVHPAVSELRGARVVLARLLAQLGLPDPADAAMPSTSTVRARKAARARWGERGATTA
jgi:hypothetical protein